MAKDKPEHNLYSNIIFNLLLKNINKVKLLFFFFFWDNFKKISN